MEEQKERFLSKESWRLQLLLFLKQKWVYFFCLCHGSERHAGRSCSLFCICEPSSVSVSQCLALTLSFKVVGTELRDRLVGKVRLPPRQRRAPHQLQLLRIGQRFLLSDKSADEPNGPGLVSLSVPDQRSREERERSGWGYDTHLYSHLADERINTSFLMMQFKHKIEAERLPPQLIRGIVPLAMTQYVRMFNTTRIPSAEGDELRHYEGFEVRPHAAVLRRGFIYRLDYVNAQGSLLTPVELQHQLDRIKADADSRWEEVRGRSGADGRATVRPLFPCLSSSTSIQDCSICSMRELSFFYHPSSASERAPLHSRAYGAKARRVGELPPSTFPTWHAERDEPGGY